MHLRLVFDGMPLVVLQRIKPALGSASDARTIESLKSAIAPISPPLESWIGLHDDRNVAWVHATVSTVVDVLQALSSTSTMHATSEQVHATVVNVIEGRLDRLPLPQGSPCFCDRGRQYADCHGRPSAPARQRRTPRSRTP
ncbi:MAG: SEC-C metal-binding domain-containing protein [Mycobacterium sp.]